MISVKIGQWCFKPTKVFGSHPCEADSSLTCRGSLYKFIGLRVLCWMQQMLKVWIRSSKYFLNKYVVCASSCLENLMWKHAEQSSNGYYLPGAICGRQCRAMCEVVVCTLHFCKIWAPVMSLWVCEHIWRLYMTRHMSVEAYMCFLMSCEHMGRFIR